jgi:hypothetical protein
MAVCLLCKFRSHKRRPTKVDVDVDIKSTENLVGRTPNRQIRPAIAEPATECVHLILDDYDMCDPIVK